MAIILLFHVIVYCRIYIGNDFLTFPIILLFHVIVYCRIYIGNDFLTFPIILRPGVIVKKINAFLYFFEFKI
jgi:hypothetical protein